MQIAIDIESKDPSLKILGPGAQREDGFIIGTALYSEVSGTEWWGAEAKPWQGLVDNFKALEDPAIDIIGANILYDLEWLKAIYNFNPLGKIIDIQLAERILNPNAKSVKLGALAEKYLGEVKQFDEILDWWDAFVLAFDKKAGKAIEHMDRVPIALVEKYARDDARQTYQIWEKQEKLLKADVGLLSAFERESELLKIFLEMRFTGVPFDLEKSKEIEDKMNAQLFDLNRVIEKEFGAVILDKKKKANKLSIEEYCNAKNIAVPKTPTGQPQLKNDWLLKQSDPALNSIVRRDVITKLRNDFVVGIRKFVHDGKIKCSYHPFKSDENGTITGRLAATKPNLQQMSKRDQEYGSLIRSQFAAPPGQTWIRADFNQQEVRVFVHYACKYEIEEAFNIRNIYLNDPNADFYNTVVGLCHASGYSFITRNHAKTLMLASLYGMGKFKLALTMGISQSDADLLLKAFYGTLPFIKDMQKYCAAQVNEYGYIETIGKRRIYFEDYQKKIGYEDRQKLFKEDPKNEDLKIRRYSELLKTMSRQQIARDYELAYSFKALNYLCQGSSADVTKLAMINCSKAGLCLVSSVHDEINIIADDADVEKSVAVLKEQMENTFKMMVPQSATIEVGGSWGEGAVYARV